MRKLGNFAEGEPCDLCGEQTALRRRPAAIAAGWLVMHCDCADTDSAKQMIRERYGLADG
jgi:hypothetical protein